MKKIIVLAVGFWFSTAIGVKAQYLKFPSRDLYDTEVMAASLNAHRQMYERVSQIMHAVQPYRKQQYEYYRDGKYREAIELCLEVYKQYVHYAFDNKAISDMEVLAGDCAVKLCLYEAAIDLYQIAQKAGEDGVPSKLSQIFNLKMNDARTSYRNSNYSALWNDVSIALKTGWENGECYFYYGVCYEKSNKLADAKKMYKLARKKNYSPAVIALQKLKKKK